MASAIDAQTNAAYGVAIDAFHKESAFMKPIHGTQQNKNLPNKKCA
jgi:hypothetical protein